MNIVPWKKKLYDPVNDLFDSDHPLFGLSFLPFSNRFVDSCRGHCFPAVDYTEDKDKIVVKADLPGLKKEDISVTLNNGFLTIRGERKYEDEKKEKDYNRIERSYGVFERSLELGSNVDESSIKASYKDGVLELTLPKTQNPKSSSIRIE